MCLCLISSLLNQFFFPFSFMGKSSSTPPLMIHALSFHSLWILKEL